MVNYYSPDQLQDFLGGNEEEISKWTSEYKGDRQLEDLEERAQLLPVNSENIQRHWAFSSEHDDSYDSSQLMEIKRSSSLRTIVQELGAVVRRSDDLIYMRMLFRYRWRKVHDYAIERDSESRIIPSSDSTALIRYQPEVEDQDRSNLNGMSNNIIEVGKAIVQSLSNNISAVTKRTANQEEMLYEHTKFTRQEIDRLRGNADMLATDINNRLDYQELEQEHLIQRVNGTLHHLDQDIGFITDKLAMHDYSIEEQADQQFDYYESMNDGINKVNTNIHKVNDNLDSIAENLATVETLDTDMDRVFAQIKRQENQNSQVDSFIKRQEKKNSQVDSFMKRQENNKSRADSSMKNLKSNFHELTHGVCADFSAVLAKLTDLENKFNNLQSDFDALKKENTELKLTNTKLSEDLKKVSNDVKPVAEMSTTVKILKKDTERIDKLYSENKKAQSDFNKGVDIQLESLPTDYATKKELNVKQTTLTDKVKSEVTSQLEKMKDDYNQQITDSLAKLKVDAIPSTHTLKRKTTKRGKKSKKSNQSPRSTPTSPVIMYDFPVGQTHPERTGALLHILQGVEVEGKRLELSDKIVPFRTSPKHAASPGPSLATTRRR
ncbi:unnamed protein product [Ambrosiozyma monospora]|uniref:Unnamed protein product n=1 Tax=Ambrosiozyma monospora TaxID=43982 RepID=A0A9W6YZL5_AMBMO|nr:unnamed protein product [Ambrosiozyma monospora]